MSNSKSLNLHPDGTLFIVSGPSGAGKTSLIERVRADLDRIGIALHFSVSHTTRRARTTECDGKHYHFVTPERFEAMIRHDEFIEYAVVHGHRYGTSRQEVQTRLDRAEDVILDIDVQGARRIAENALLKPHTLNVFVFPPSYEALERRIRDRGLNSEQEIALRLEKAMDEIETGISFYDSVIINDDFDVAAESLKAAMIARKLSTSSARSKVLEMTRRFKEEQRGRVARGY